MNNNMLMNIQKNYPNATEKNIKRIMEAKNPLDTKQGRTCVNNGYYALNAYIAGEWTFDKIVPYRWYSRRPAKSLPDGAKKLYFSPLQKLREH